MKIRMGNHFFEKNVIYKENLEFEINIYLVNKMSLDLEPILLRISVRPPALKIWNSMAILPQDDLFSSMRDISKIFFDSGLKSIKESSYLYRAFKCDPRTCLGLLLLENIFLCPEIPTYFLQILSKLIAEKYFETIDIFLQFISLLVDFKIKEQNGPKKTNIRLFELFNKSNEFREGLEVFLDVFLSLHSKKPIPKTGDIITFLNKFLDFSICSAFFENRTFVFLHGKGENLEISSKFTEIEQKQNIVLYSLGYSKAFFSDFGGNLRESEVKTLKTSKTAIIKNENIDLHEELIRDSARLLKMSKTSEASYFTARDTFGSQIQKNEELIKVFGSEIEKNEKKSEIIKNSKTEENKNNEETSKISKSSKISENSQKKIEDLSKNPSEILKNSKTEEIKNNEEPSKILKSSKISETSQKKIEEQQILKFSKREENKEEPSKILKSFKNSEKSSKISEISQKNEPNLVRSVLSVENDENSGSALKQSEFLERKSSKQAEIQKNEENKEENSINSDFERKNEEIKEKMRNLGGSSVLTKSVKKSEVLSICQNFNCQKKGETSKNFINARCGHCFCYDCLQALFLEGNPTRCPKNMCFERLDVVKVRVFLDGKEEDFEFGEEGKNNQEEKGKNLSQRVALIEDQEVKKGTKFIRKTFGDVCQYSSCENHNPKHFFLVKDCGHIFCEKCLQNCLENGNMCLGNYCFAKIDKDDIKEFFEEKKIVLDNLKKSDLVMKDNLGLVRNQANLI